MLAAAASGNCILRNDWVCWRYVTEHSDDLLGALRQHVGLTVNSVVAAVLITVPLALLARRYRWLQAPLLGLTGAVYTIPSLALFALLLPFTHLTALTVEIGLVAYALLILLRNFLAGLAGVPSEVREAARGMGFGPVRMLVRVELPLALPALVAGLRVATVSTIALVTVGAVVGYGGLGGLIYDGLGRVFKAEVLTASVLCVALAVAADLLLLGVQRLLTPWEQRR